MLVCPAQYQGPFFGRSCKTGSLYACLISFHVCQQRSLRRLVLPDSLFSFLRNRGNRCREQNIFRSSQLFLQAPGSQNHEPFGVWLFFYNCLTVIMYGIKDLVEDLTEHTYDPLSRQYLLLSLTD